MRIFYLNNESLPTMFSRNELNAKDILDTVQNWSLSDLSINNSNQVLHWKAQKVVVSEASYLSIMFQTLLGS